MPKQTADMAEMDMGAPMITQNFALIFSELEIVVWIIVIFSILISALIPSSRVSVYVKNVSTTTKLAHLGQMCSKELIQTHSLVAINSTTTIAIDTSRTPGKSAPIRIERINHHYIQTMTVM